MLNLLLWMKVATAIAAFTPPSLPDSRSVLQRLGDAGISTDSREPVSGICFVMLPARTPNEVDRVRLPKSSLRLSTLRLLSKLPNLRSVTCERELSEAEYRVLNQSVSRDVWILCQIRLADGTVVRNVRSTTHPSLCLLDVNNDGIVTEADDYLTLDPVHRTPPRIQLSK